MLESGGTMNSNYESRRTVTGPGTSRTEYHEYRSYTSGGGGGNNDAGDDFSLERQVQHMMPPGSLSDRSVDYLSSGLQSANMVSSVQQQKQSYSSYKVETNQVNFLWLLGNNTNTTYYTRSLYKV